MAQLEDVRAKLRTKLSDKERARTRKIYKKLMEKRYPSPLKQLSGRAIDAQAESDVALEYAPQERAAEQRQRDVPVWFQEYRDKQQQLQRSTVGAYDNAAALTRAGADSAAAMDATNTAQRAQQMQADATMRGATLDPSVAATADQAAAARRASVEAFAAQMQTQGANQTAAFNDRIGIADRDKVEQLGKESRRLGAIRQERGRAKAKRKGELREGERKYALEQSAFGLEREKAAADVAADQASLAIQQQNANTAEGRLDETTRHNQVMETKPSGKSGGGLTPATKRETARRTQKVIGQLNLAVKNGVLRRKDGSAVARVNPKNEKKIATLAQSRVGDELLAKAIAQQMVWGGIGPGMESALRKKFRMPIKSLGFKRSPKLK